MASPAFRREILAAYARLNRVSRQVFRDDKETLNTFKKKLGNDFRANKEKTFTEKEAKDLLKAASEIETIIKSYIIPVEVTDRGTYRLRIKPEHLRGENPPLSD